MPPCSPLVPPRAARGMKINAATTRCRARPGAAPEQRLRHAGAHLAECARSRRALERHRLLRLLRGLRCQLPAQHGQAVHRDGLQERWEAWGVAGATGSTIWPPGAAQRPCVLLYFVQGDSGFPVPARTGGLVRWIAESWPKARRASPAPRIEGADGWEASQLSGGTVGQAPRAAARRSGRGALAQNGPRGSG